MSEIKFNKVQQAIFWCVTHDIPRDSKLEFIHRKIHRLLQVEVPINRLELAELCEHEIVHATKQPWQRHISDYKRLAVEAGILEVYSPKEFISQNPIENPGINFSPNGGYGLYNEILKEIHNFKTCDEANKYIMEHPEWRSEGVAKRAFSVGGMMFTPDDGKEIYDPTERKPRIPGQEHKEDMMREAEKLIENIDIDD